MRYAFIGFILMALAFWAGRKGFTLLPGTNKNMLVSYNDTAIKITNAGYDAPTSYNGYSLAWADECNGPSLDTTNWSFQNGDGCPAVCGWGNNELECYTS